VHSLQQRVGAAALVAGVGAFFFWLARFGGPHGLTFTGSVLETLAVALAVAALAATVRGARDQGRLRPKVVLALLVSTLAIVVPAVIALLLLAAIVSRIAQAG
jgi:hypothetical protein